jgi:hypothetical protein
MHVTRKSGRWLPVRIDEEAAGSVLPARTKGETSMTAVAVELLARPPESADVVEPGTPPALAPDAVEFVADTDTPLTMWSCSASSSQPY